MAQRLESHAYRDHSAAQPSLDVLASELRKARAGHSKVGLVRASLNIPVLFLGPQQSAAEERVLEILLGRVRSSVRETDTCFLNGPRELLVVLPGVSVPTHAVRIGEAIARTLRFPISVANRILQVGANAGVAVSGLHGNTAGRMFEQAAEGIFEARKRPGKGAYMMQPRLRARVLVGPHRRELRDPRSDARRATDTQDWTGPRSER
jgi:predicted signal transduction protein with EAL and GGDEF domain